jgi:transposase
VPEVARNLGIDLMYLPGYSPDLNAIELAFSKLKAHLRKAAALTFDALSHALGEALEAVTLQDIRGFFREVGCWRQYL